MDKQYYFDYYQAERKHWFFKARNRIIMQHVADLIKNKKDLKILNIGVATGHTSELLSEFGAVKSVEFDEDCFEFTKKQCPQLDLIRGSILELPFEDSSYDIVCAFDVIEHIEDDATGVTEMQRVCKKGGNVVLTVPAFMSLWSHHDVINHHFKRYKKSEIKSLLTPNSNIVYLTYFNFFLFPPVWLFRKLNNLLGFTSKDKSKDDSAGSDLEMFKDKSIISKTLYSILSSERPFIKRKVVMPFGVSVLASWVKEIE